MDTAKYGHDKNSNSQFNVISLLAIGFSFVVLVGVTGCFDSSSDDTTLDSESSKVGVEGASNTPSNHTDSVSGFLHAPGKDTPFTSWCTACHGQALEGDIGPACTACHGQLWTETTPPSSGGRTSNAPSNHTDDVNSFLHAPGKDTPYTSFCTACHGADLAGGVGPTCTACHGEVWTETSPPSSGGGDTGGGSSGSTDGQALYNANCSGCHGDGSAIVNNTADGITTAINTLGSMNGITLSATEIQAISDFLTGNTGGGTGGGSTSGPPASHTNPEDGIMHAPGNDLPYTNGCTMCHGPTLEGGVGPSCKNCHGEEWSESPPSAGGDNTGGGSSEGQALYTTHCSGCHGVTGSGLTGRSVDAISTAISNVTTMNSIALSLTELQAIADYLSSTTGGSTGGGDTGGGDTGGGTGGGGTVDGATLYADNCALCHGATGSGINDPSVNGITAAMTGIGSMTGINVNATEIQAISDFLTGSTGGDTGGGDTGGGTGGGGTVDGATLYADNCALCHGATGSGINDPSVNGITAAMTGIGSMTGINVNTTEIQAISDFLTGGTGGGTGGGDTGGGDTGGGLPASHTNSEEGVLHADGNNFPYTNGCTACHGSTLQGGVGPSCFACHGVEWNESAPGGGGDTGGGTGGGSGTVDGATLYADNCALCHGATGSGINDPSVNGITAAMTSIGSMTGINVNATEIQAISDFLTGSTGGGTGGGDTGGGDTGGGTGGGSGTVDGATLYADNCALCHGATGSGINDPSVNGITAAMTSIGSMTGINVNATEIQAISDFLTGSTGGGTGGGDTGGGDTGGGTGGTVDGQALYTANCAACHGATGSNINGRTVSAIDAAIANIGSMNNISLTAAETQAISDYLTGSTGGTGGGTGGGDTGGGDTDGPPASHTNAEDGILHAPGNNTPYSNGCTACHGTTLQGGIGPSCFACHGQEWNESAPSDGGDGGGTGGGSTGGGTTTDGLALYTTYCAACHGTSGAGINGRTASAISSAIANIGTMNSISLTSAEVQAIADYLTGSIGSGGTGGSGSGGLPANHTNGEEGVLHAPGNSSPYSNGCTSCHGSDLRGGVGPSCFACHGQEWSESGSGSSGGDGGGSSDGGGSEEEED